MHGHLVMMVVELIEMVSCAINDQMHQMTKSTQFQVSP